MKVVLFILALITFAPLGAFASDTSVVCGKVAELLDIDPMSTEQSITFEGRSKKGSPCQLRATVKESFCDISIETSNRKKYGAYFPITGLQSWWTFSKIDLTEGHMNIRAFFRDGDLSISDDGITGGLEKETFSLSTEQNKLTVVYTKKSGLVFSRTRSASCIVEL